jgi:hypothetical protein
MASVIAIAFTDSVLVGSGTGFLVGLGAGLGVGFGVGSTRTDDADGLGDGGSMTSSLAPALGADCWLCGSF